VVTGDLFNLYVFLEISSLAGYALLAVGDIRSVVAAFRYLIVGTLAATFYRPSDKVSWVCILSSYRLRGS